jgi:hypothetical protein
MRGPWRSTASFVAVAAVLAIGIVTPAFSVVWNISASCRRALEGTLTDVARAKQAAHQISVRLGGIRSRLALRLAKRVLSDETSAETSLTTAATTCTADDGPTALSAVKSKMSARTKREIFLISLLEQHLIASSPSNGKVVGATRDQLDGAINQALSLSTDGITASL